MAKRLNSREKGKRGERAFRDVLREAGYLKARRGQQYSGEQGNPDVVCEELPSIHWEVKVCETSKPYIWLEQAKGDTWRHPQHGRMLKVPIVAHKRNGKQWIAILDMRDLLEIIRRSDLPRLSNGLRHDAFITTETGCYHFKDKTVQECLDAYLDNP